MTLFEKAKQWRQDNPVTGGVVIFNRRGIVQGWTNQIRDPHHWKPGCIAIDESGRQWVTVGGSAKDGAESWKPA